MPQLGETVAEGKITTWFKAIGGSPGWYGMLAWRQDDFELAHPHAG